MTSNSASPSNQSSRSQANFAAGPLPPDVNALLAYVAQRRLLRPLILFVFAHRPLGFVAGQLLFAAQPITLLFPSLNLRVWAEILSDVDGMRHVEEQILAAAKEQSSQARTAT